ncbi:rhomboid family intramembrane serine protease [Sphingobacterium sp. HJSM2_6]|uniref:rhomboid family intramembrane serine protease n=1 Tax=Sphingobacterium sp. HJSM2_6 TaxID=3366264 RepID=UPI003BE9663A
MLLDYLINLPVASLIFALTIGLSIYVFSNPEWYGKLMLHPYSIYRDKSKSYLILTSGLIHKDWSHLLFNMITFYFFGFGLEAIFVSISGSLGHLLFALLYIVGLILSDIPTIIRQKDQYGYHSLGASGAISAVLFSYILFNPTTKIYIFFALPLPAFVFAGLYIGYCVWASKNARDGINHDAHLFGALTGLILTILIFPDVIQHFISQF